MSTARTASTAPDRYFLGLDLAQVQDYTALAGIKRIAAPLPRGDPGPAQYHVGYLERVRGVPYPEIVSRVQGVVGRPELVTWRDGWTPGQPEAQLPTLVVDRTGVGAAVFDMLRDAKLAPIGITITGGADPAVGVQGLSVPKRDLVATVQVLLQTGRLKIAEELQLASTLTRELLNFQVRIDPRTAHDSYGAWREGTHDDLVLAVALAVWYGESRKARDTSPWPVIRF